jgi:hypothetical protein
MSDVQTEGLTFEKVWAALMENREQMKETDRRMQETDWQMKETDRRMQETDRQMKEAAQRMKETDKLIGKLGSRFGEMIEHLVVPNITNKFNALGFNFNHVSENHKINDEAGHCLAEIDILLENGETVMAVEVKSKPNQNDINEHIKRMEILRNKADTRNDKRKFQGAVAGAIVDENVRSFAYQKGFYVIVQSGDTVKIDIPDGFNPREW